MPVVKGNSRSRGSTLEDSSSVATNQVWVFLTDQTQTNLFQEKIHISFFEAFFLILNFHVVSVYM